MNFLPLTKFDPTESLGWVKVSQQIDAEKCDSVNQNNNIIIIIIISTDKFGDMSFICRPLVRKRPNFGPESTFTCKEHLTFCSVVCTVCEDRDV